MFGALGWMSPSVDFGRRFIIDTDNLLLISLVFEYHSRGNDI